MRRSAFTLFEVILALAILVGAMAVLGELVRGGLISAERARDLSRGTLICEGKMAQIVAGIQAPDPVSSALVEDEMSGEWIYSVEVSDTTSPYLLAVRVSVQRDVAAGRQPAVCTLVRWIKSPDAPVASGSADTSASSGGSSTAGSSSSGGMP
jgi:general secretion pathway protein I